jgi:hypothetical protein
MKKGLMLFLIVVSTTVYSQKYVPFPTQQAQWNVYYGYSTNNEPMTYTILQYSLQGDTTINGVLYHKLCKNISSVSSPVYQFAGGLREQDKKVYFYGFGYSAYNLLASSCYEVMLYDFNKVEGETVYVRSDQPNYTIASIDSIKIGADFRKRYKLSVTNEYIIEGIGNINGGLLGLVTPITTCSMCHRSWELMCFSQNGETVYKNPSFVDCNSSLRAGIIDLNDNNAQPIQSTLQPTLSSSFVTLKFKSFDNKCESVQILDMLGKQVQFIPTSNKLEYQIDISGLNNGLYFVKLNYSDKTEFHKFLKK